MPAANFVAPTPPSSPPTTGPLDAVLTQLADSADPLIAAWATALVAEGESTDHRA